jgi:malonyl-CoA O-methyltransferase
MAPSATAHAIDGAALQRAVRRMAGAREAPWLHAEVARRMAERLPLVRLQPQRIVDWWSHMGGAAALLGAAYPRAERVAVEPASALTALRASHGATSWWQRLRRRANEPAVDAAALVPASAQLVWANMMLHLVPDPAATMQVWRAALATDGFVMLSTLGPDTLKTLRELYRDAGWGPPHAAFTDMHDIGDMLVHAGFADPVMDQEVLRLTWSSPRAALTELRGLGGNADPARQAGLRTPRWRARLEAMLAERAGPDGRIVLEFEVVYGHAFAPPPRAAVAAETRVDAEALRRMARARRHGGSLG